MEFKVKVIEIIKEIADAHIVIHNDLCHAIKGNNGPYGQNDTPVRNTAHWLIVYSCLWKKYNKKEYLDVAYKFFHYLQGCINESESGAIKCIDDETYNCLNGLIGQAYVVEAMFYFSDTFQEKEAAESAKKLFSVQRYSTYKHGWELIDIDGTPLGIDPVFNHQLWFAAIGSYFSSKEDCDEIKSEVMDFLSHLDEKFEVKKNGLIIPKGEKSRVKDIFRDIKFLIKKFMHYFNILQNPSQYDKYVFQKGYHLYNLYAYEILRNQVGDLNMPKSIKWKKAFNYGRNLQQLNKDLNQTKFVNKRDKTIDLNCYSYAYNSPAFEFPYIYASLYKKKDENFMELCNGLLDFQMEALYDSKIKEFSNNTGDKETLTARMYELIRFLDYVDKSEVFIHSI